MKLITQIKISTEAEAKVLNDLLVSSEYIESDSDINPVAAFNVGCRVIHLDEAKRFYEGASSEFINGLGNEAHRRYTLETFLLPKGLVPPDKTLPKPVVTKPVVMLRLSCGGAIIDDGKNLIIHKGGAKVSVSKEEVESVLSYKS